jgi:hypothetical protein
MNPLRPGPTKQNLHQLTGHKWQPALLRLILSDTILGDRPDAMIEGGVFRADRARGVSAGRRTVQAGVSLQLCRMRQGSLIGWRDIWGEPRPD